DDRASSLHFFFFVQCYRSHRDLLSFPTRRSSDLRAQFTLSLILCCFSRDSIRDTAASSTPLYSRHLRVESSARLSMMVRASHERSEEHTSELQSRENLVCRLLLEKKNKTRN